MMQGSVQSSTINLRIPSWTTANDAKVTLNGQSLAISPNGINRRNPLLDFLFHRRETEQFDLWFKFFFNAPAILFWLLFILHVVDHFPIGLSPDTFNITSLQ